MDERKGKVHDVDCLHREAGVTICTCRPTSTELLLELRVPGGEWYKFRDFVEWCHVPGNVEVRLVDGVEDANTFPVLKLPPHQSTITFEPGSQLRLVLERDETVPDPRAQFDKLVKTEAELYHARTERDAARDVVRRLLGGYTPHYDRSGIARNGMWIGVDNMWIGVDKNDLHSMTPRERDLVAELNLEVDRG